MKRRFTVAIGDGGSGVALHRSVLASLPGHFSIVDSGPADAVLLSGEGTGNQARVSVLDGRALLARQLLRGGAAFPAFPFLPRLAASALADRAREVAWTLVDIMTTVERSNEAGYVAALVEQLAIVRLLTGFRARMLTGRRIRTGYVATGRVVGTNSLCTFAGLISPVNKATLTIDAVANVSRLRVEIDADAMARAGVIQLIDQDGRRETPPVFQNSHRLTWLKAYDALSGEAGSWDPAELLEDIEEAGRAL